MARKSEGDLDLMTKRKKAVERFSRAFNCPSECTEHGLVSTVEIPGWTYGDFAGNGKLAIWRMAKTFEVHRLLQEKNSKRSDHYSKDENVFRYDLRVAASDMDQLYHTNQATYYRFCMDAAAEAWRAGALTFDPDERDVRRTEARHLGETFGGDDLTVCLWSEAEGREPRLHYVIKKGESRVFCCNIVFYPQLDTAKL